MPQVPEERPQPYEIPIREIEHDEPAELDAYPWEAGRYPVGTIRDREWWGTDEQNEAEHTELIKREESRKRLGGFGFSLARAGQ